jgi:hypothetical protein
MHSSQRLLGLLLIAIGTGLFAILQTGVGAEAVVALIGGALLVAYGVTRAYGFLVPGSILTGLGTGIILQGRGAPDETVVLGLGAGFLAIAAIDVLVHGLTPARLWPLIPGGILTIVGLSAIPGGQALLRLWPLALIAAGAWLIVGQGVARRAAPSPPVTPAPRPPDAQGDATKLPAPPEVTHR